VRLAAAKTQQKNSFDSACVHVLREQATSAHIMCASHHAAANWKLEHEILHARTF